MMTQKNEQRTFKKLGGDITQLETSHVENRPAGQAETQLAAILEQVAPSKTGASVFRSRRPLFAIVAVAAVGILIFLLFSSNVPNFEVDGAPGLIGKQIYAASANYTRLSFNDGSHVRLSQGARAAVASVSNNGAQLRLDNGSAYVSVVHRDRTQWQVNAGPFLVEVTGTAFLIRWDSTEKQFDIQMDEGRVLLTGPTISSPKSIGKGQRYSVRISDSTGDIQQSPTNVADQMTSGQQSEPKAVQQHRKLKSAQSSVHQPSAELESWKSLAAQRKYPEALKAAQNVGFDKLCKQLDGTSLLRLADVSRFTGKTALEVQALIAVRNRFKGSPEAANATYLLASSAFRQRKYRQAEKWNLTYLAEYPNGALAEHALGKNMEIQHQQGRGAMARSTAQKYLQLFPNGSRSGLAHKLVP